MIFFFSRGASKPDTHVDLGFIRYCLCINRVRFFFQLVFPAKLSTSLVMHMDHVKFMKKRSLLGHVLYHAGPSTI